MRQPTLLLFMSIQNRRQAIQEPGNSIQGLRASDSALEARDSTLRTGVAVRQPSTEQASTTTPCRQCEVTCPHVISNRYALRQFTLIRFRTRISASDSRHLTVDSKLWKSVTSRTACALGRGGVIGPHGRVQFDC